MMLKHLPAQPLSIPAVVEMATSSAAWSSVKDNVVPTKELVSRIFLLTYF